MTAPTLLSLALLAAIMTEYIIRPLATRMEAAIGESH